MSHVMFLSLLGISEHHNFKKNISIQCILIQENV
jgi:hypothetical protein